MESSDLVRVGVKVIELQKRLSEVKQIAFTRDFQATSDSKRRVEGLYIDFSDWGSDPRRNRKVRKLVGKENRHGNFITYAHRAQRAFPSDDVLVDVSRHKHKIRKRSERVLGGESPPGE